MFLQINSKWPAREKYRPKSKLMITLINEELPMYKKAEWQQRIAGWVKFRRWDFTFICDLSKLMTKRVVFLLGSDMMANIKSPRKLRQHEQIRKHLSIVCLRPKTLIYPFWTIWMFGQPVISKRKCKKTIHCHKHILYECWMPVIWIWFTVPFSTLQLMLKICASQ